MNNTEEPPLNAAKKARDTFDLQTQTARQNYMNIKNDFENILLFMDVTKKKLAKAEKEYSDALENTIKAQLIVLKLNDEKLQIKVKGEKELLET